MAARSRRNNASKPTRGQTVDRTSNDSGDPIEKDASNRSSFGNAQRWLFGVVAALTAATLILNGDGLTLEGDNILIALAWSLLATVLLFARWYRKSPFRFDAPVSSPRTMQPQNENETCRNGRDGGWHWFDLVAAMFFGWVFVSFAAVWYSGDGAPRAMLTMLTHWFGYAAMFVTWRLLIDGRQIIRGVILLFVALIVAETTTAYYDYFYLGPQRRAVFLENRDRALAENNAFSEGEQELMVNRIESIEPLGTYSLTNSLAGVLAPWCVFLCGLLLLGRNRIELPHDTHADDHPDLQHEKLRHWRFTLLSMILVAFVGFILLMTHSRSGVIATLFGMACLIVCVVVVKVRNKRVLFRSAILACVAIVAALGIGFASGKLSGETVSEATKSFGYRLQYWQSSSMMIADHPIFGCGVGNFREYYTQYKLPTASESIADPHNLFFEIATNAGLPALVCFVVLLVAAIVCALASKSKTVDMSPSDAAQQGDESSRLSNGRPTDNFFPGISVAVQTYLPFIIGGCVGLVVATVYSYTNYVSIAPDVACFALTGFVVGAVLFAPVVDSISLPLHILSPICLLVLMVNLLAAGGISFPHVNVTFWFLTALCFYYVRGKTFDPSTAKAGRRRADVAFLCVAPCFLAFIVVLYPTAYLANLRANSVLRNMQANVPQFAFLDKRIAEFEKIVKHDPYRTQILVDLCDAYLLEQREFPALAQKRPDTSNWRPLLERRMQEAGIFRNLDRTTLNGTTAEALAGAVVSSPLSTTMYRGLGLAFFEDYERTRNAGSLDLAIVLFELAATRYPNNSLSYAYVALCYGQSGETELQQQAARKAIELDDIMPHSDQKMPAELRRIVNTLVK